MTMITTENVAAGFDEVAPRYDLMVALNPGYHAHLRAAADALVEWLPRPEVSAEPSSPVRLLDLGCGSGASTRAALQAAQAAGLGCTIVGVDASSGMIEQARDQELARRRTVSRSVRPRSAPGLVSRGELMIPSTESLRHTCSAMLPAGMRCSPGSSTLLADDGVLVVQEYSIAGSGPWAQALWAAVCWLVIIPLGRLTSGRTRLYHYLWRSVRAFDSVQTFVDRLYAAGFVDVEVRTVAGWQRGILHTFRARKRATA